MTNVAVEKIKAAEASAAEKTADAEKKARDIVSGSRQTGAQLKEEAGRKAVSLLKEASSNAEEKAAQIIDAGISEARSEAKRLVSQATQNADEASEIIIRGIFEKWQ